MSSPTLPKNSPVASGEPQHSGTRGFNPGLIALSIGGFGIGLTEFVISGLLSDVAGDLHVSIPAAGALVWAYALAVVAGAFTVTAALSRRPPRSALLMLLALFVAGNAITAAAPVFALAVLGRVVTALCHGGFFGIGAVVAADLVPAHRRASAIAVMFGGLTLANVLGVPFGTLIGQHLGWRSTFWIIAGLGVAAMAGIALLVPSLPAPPTEQPRRQYTILRRRQVLVSLALTTTMFGGLFGAFIYVEPLVRHVTGYSESAVPWLLVAFGVGLFAGNIVGGRAADKNLGVTLRTLAVLLPLVLIAYGLAAPSRILVAIALVVVGLVGFAATPAFQLRVMRFAGDTPTLASAANIAAFNLGNALGAALGGLAISIGLGWRSPIFVGAAMAAVGTVLAFTNQHGDTT